MKTFNAYALQEKFGDFLSFCVLQKMNVEVLSARIASDPYFDFMEKNDVASFMQEDNEAIYRRLFAKRLAPVDNGVFDNAAKWCGFAYISISVSLAIPLRKVFLLYPLPVGMGDFALYHELPPSRIVKRFERDFGNRSAIDALLETKPRIPYGTPLATLLKCDLRTLRKLKDDASFYEKAPSSLLNAICEHEGWDEVFFRKSKFVPYYPALWNDSFFKQSLGEFLWLCFAKRGEPEPLFINAYAQKGEAIPEHYSGVVYSQEKAIDYLVGKPKRMLEPSAYEIAIAYAIDQFREHLLRQDKAYC